MKVLCSCSVAAHVSIKYVNAHLNFLFTAADAYVGCQSALWYIRHIRQVLGEVFCVWLGGGGCSKFALCVVPVFEIR